MYLNINTLENISNTFQILLKWLSLSGNMTIPVNEVEPVEACLISRN